MKIERGTRVSLNKERRSYYFQGPNGINLRLNLEESAIIPDNITDHNLEMIRKSIATNQLVVGWAKELKPDVKYKEDDKKLLEKGVKKLIPYLEEIVKSPGKDDNSPIARLEKLLKWEQENKKRKTVVNKIEELLSNMGGISTVEEDEKEELQINLI